MLRVLSFDTPLAISGITMWNLRMAQAYRERPELGVEWHAVEVGDAEEYGAAADLVADAGERLSFVNAPSDDSVFDIFRRAYRQHPEWREADVVVPNGVFQGWLLPAELQREFGHRPAVLGSIHNDMDIAYDMSGRGVSAIEGVFAVSTFCAEEFERRYGMPAAFVPYGVPVASGELAKPESGPLELVFCGRVVTEQKRVMDLARLADRLAANHADFILHVVGDGPERPALEQATRHHGPRVVVHGPLLPSAITPFLSDKHVIVSVSDYEGTSISMLEAMGQGLVPVVTRIKSGVNDAIVEGESGFLSPIGDVDDMAANIQRLAGDRAKLARMAVAARDLVERNYGMGLSASRMADLLHEVVQVPRANYAVARDHPILNRRLDRAWLPGWAVKTARRLRASTGL